MELVVRCHLLFLHSFACGKTLKKSCELATKYVNNSIRSNLNYGKGHGPINHLSSIIINKKFR